MVARGGMSFREWRYLKDVGLVSLYMEGLEKREVAVWEVGRILGKIISSFGGGDNFKRDDFPYKLPWDKDNLQDSRNMEEKESELQQAIEEFNKLNNNGER